MLGHYCVVAMTLQNGSRKWFPTHTQALQHKHDLEHGHGRGQPLGIVQCIRDERGNTEFHNMCSTSQPAPANPFESGTPAHLLFEQLRQRIAYLGQSKTALDVAQANHDGVTAKVDEFRAAIKAITGKKSPI